MRKISSIRRRNSRKIGNSLGLMSHYLPLIRREETQKAFCREIQQTSNQIHELPPFYSSRTQTQIQGQSKMSIIKSRTLKTSVAVVSTTVKVAHLNKVGVLTSYKSLERHNMAASHRLLSQVIASLERFRTTVS